MPYQGTHSWEVEITIKANTQPGQSSDELFTEISRALKGVLGSSAGISRKDHPNMTMTSRPLFRMDLPEEAAK